MPKRPVLVLFDGNAIVHRGFHALPPLTNAAGEQTGAIYGFAMILLKAIQDIKPDYAVVAWDATEQTFRSSLSTAYKANRVATDKDLKNQFPRVKELVTTLGLPLIEAPGYEADDIIATLARRHEATHQVIVVTGDMDALQLVSPNVSVYLMRRGLTDLVNFTPEEVMNRYGFRPDQVIDYKSLRGDTSDNIPGVPGIGEKTAVSLLQDYDNLANIYKHLGEIPDSKRRLLEVGHESALLSQELATAVTDLSFELSLEAAQVGNYNREHAVELFRELGFRSLLPKLPEPIRSSEHEAREIAHRARLEVITVDDESKLKALEQAIADSSYFAFDTETDSLDSINANLVGLSISTKPGKGYYLPIGHREGEQLAKGRVIEVFNSILSSDKLKIAHNLKFDLEVCETFGLLVAPPYFDTMLAAYLISPGNRAESLSNLSFQEFGEEMQPITELIGKGKGQICFAEVPISEASYYSAEDAEVTFRLYELLSKRLTAEGLAELLETVELPLVPILAQMERRGITVDTSYLGKLSVELEKEIATLEKQIYQLAGTEFNIASPAQLGEILFTRLGLPSAQIKKGKTGYSTAASELDKLKGEHKIIEEIFSYRELVKLKNTYIDALPVLVSAKDGRVHTDFNQAIAATGRLSSSNPNLQNIPNRTEVGRRVRRAFVAGKGNELISADYSQIELRIIAQLAHEKNLIQAFRQGADIHTETAAKVAGISEQKVTREMRYAAKAVNFGLMYGLSAHGLAASTGMSREDAASFIKRYFELYPGIASYIDNTKRQAKEQGFVSTLLGRKRYLPEINSNNFVVRGAAERMAINMPVQGTAADMMKLAMIKIQDTIGDDAGMLLQVHDELVFEVPKGKVRELSKRIKRIMEEALKLEVPIVVDVKSGSSWDEMRAVEL